MNYYEVDTFEYDAQQYYEGKGYVSRKTYKPGEIGGNSGDVLFDIGYYDRYGFKFIFEGVTLRTNDVCNFRGKKLRGKLCNGNLLKQSKNRAINLPDFLKTEWE